MKKVVKICILSLILGIVSVGLSAIVDLPLRFVFVSPGFSLKGFGIGVLAGQAFH